MWSGSWDDVFEVSVGLYLVGTAVWNLFSTGEKVIDWWGWQQILSSHIPDTADSGLLQVPEKICNVELIKVATKRRVTSIFLNTAQEAFNWLKEAQIYYIEDTMTVVSGKGIVRSSYRVEFNPFTDTTLCLIGNLIWSWNCTILFFFQIVSMARCKLSRIKSGT